MHIFNGLKINAVFESFRSSCSSKSSTIDKIQASYDDLERTNSFIQSQLDKMKREWEEKSELLKSSQIRYVKLFLCIQKFKTPY